MKKIPDLILRSRHSRWMAAVLLLIGLLADQLKRSKAEKTPQQLYAIIPSFCRSTLSAEDKAALMALLRAGTRFLSLLASL